MKFLFDLLPIIFFFGTFKYAESHTDVAVSFATQLLGSGITAEMAPILLSTAVAILASLVQLIYLIVMRRKIETMFWISVAVIVIFGGMTLYFRDGAFIKWKPTILYWTFAAILLWGECTGRNFMKKMLEKAEMNLPESAWQTLQRAWIGFFIAMGVINLLVAYLFSTDTWVLQTLWAHGFDNSIYNWNWLFYRKSKFRSAKLSPIGVGKSQYLFGWRERITLLAFSFLRAFHRKTLKKEAFDYN